MRRKETREEKNIVRERRRGTKTEETTGDKKVETTSRSYSKYWKETMQEERKEDQRRGEQSRGCEKEERKGKERRKRGQVDEKGREGWKGREGRAEVEAEENGM